MGVRVSEVSAVDPVLMNSPIRCFGCCNTRLSVENNNRTTVCDIVQFLGCLRKEEKMVRESGEKMTKQRSMRPLTRQGVLVTWFPKPLHWSRCRPLKHSVPLLPLL
ncbi:hypothetical protein DPEC_G00287810 [Dallia pectoralis]|uniref:Uncharacterized protein n=1 Tax=Dallia pectoralis TaxID=75939 RepID=A0ACC2FKK6_DALPE|nr:hypothetical protein DPEC_G00287810 [Dallia pectoralis]